MKLPEEIKIDLLGCLKYMYKLSKEIRRRKIVLASFCFTIINGIIYFFIAQNSVILIVFMISASILFYNVLYPIYMWLLNIARGFIK